MKTQLITLSSIIALGACAPVDQGTTPDTQAPDEIVSYEAHGWPRKNSA